MHKSIVNRLYSVPFGNKGDHRLHRTMRCCRSFVWTSDTYIAVHEDFAIVVGSADIEYCSSAGIRVHPFRYRILHAIFLLHRT